MSESGRFQSEFHAVVRRIVSRGILDFLRAPRAALGYWLGITRAARFARENQSKEAVLLPACSVDELVPNAESFPVTLIEYQYTQGEMPLNEVITLCKLARYFKPRTLFEIGTYLGGTTFQLAANSQGTVYTLDLPPLGHKDYVKPQVWNVDSDVYPEQPGLKFLGSPFEKKIIQLFGNSQTFDFSPYYGRVDFVFVDGCHRYEFIMSDSLNALEMVSPRGVVVWHDYAEYEMGVIKALHELSRDIPLRHIEGTSLVIYRASSD